MPAGNGINQVDVPRDKTCERPLGIGPIIRVAVQELVIAWTHLILIVAARGEFRHEFKPGASPV